MAHRKDSTPFLTKEEADEHQSNLRGQPGYSETYKKGVFPCRVIHPETKEEVDGWVSKSETYYG